MQTFKQTNKKNPINLSRKETKQYNSLKPNFKSQNFSPTKKKKKKKLYLTQYKTFISFKQKQEENKKFPR